MLSMPSYTTSKTTRCPDSDIYLTFPLLFAPLTEEDHVPSEFIDTEALATSSTSELCLRASSYQIREKDDPIRSRVSRSSCFCRNIAWLSCTFQVLLPCTQTLYPCCIPWVHLVLYNSLFSGPLCILWLYMIQPPSSFKIRNRMRIIALFIFGVPFFNMYMKHSLIQTIEASLIRKKYSKYYLEYQLFSTQLPSQKFYNQFWFQQRFLHKFTPYPKRTCVCSFLKCVL